LKVIINGQPFDHVNYHFVLTYSNWAAGTVCSSECDESLAEWLQNALWQFGSVPALRHTDRISAAGPPGGHEEFTQRYQALQQPLSASAVEAKVRHGETRRQWVVRRSRRLICRHTPVCLKGTGGSAEGAAPASVPCGL
jgi:hypothetical protein